MSTVSQPLNELALEEELDTDSSSLPQSEWECEYLEETEEYKCQICEEIYVNIDDLKNHIEIIHCEFSCAKCEKRYFTESQLKKHLRHAHLPSLNLKCTFCAKILSTKYNLEQHILTHTSEPYFTCRFENCYRQFRHINSLKQHEDIHLEKNRKECPICNENVTKLSIHLLKHSLDKPFKCNECERQFTTKKHLEQHKFAFHIGGTFNCEDCSAAYKNLSSLYKHRKTIHSNAKFSCPNCSKYFNRKDNLIVHARKIHNIVLNTGSQLRRLKIN